MTDQQNDHEAEAPATSVVGLLAQRRQEIIDEQVFRFPVPRWNNPKVAITFGMVPHEEIGRAIRATVRADKKIADDTEFASAELNYNADLLIRTSEHVIIITSDNQEHVLGPIGSTSVAEALGIPSDSPARFIARQLFISDGDLMRCARELTEWSGYRNTEADEAIQGE